MDYMKVSEAAEKWELSARRVRILCQENRIEGVIRKGNLYMIPTDAKKPEDARSKGRSRIKLKKLLENKALKYAPFNKGRGGAFAR